MQKHPEPPQRAHLRRANSVQEVVPPDEEDRERGNQPPGKVNERRQHQQETRERDETVSIRKA